MPISTTCPNCRTVYNLADTLRGKKVRCTKCNGVMLVGTTAAATEGIAPRSRSQQEASRPKAPPVPIEELEEADPPRSRRLRDNEDYAGRARPRRAEEDAAPRRRRSRKRAAFPVGLVLALVGGFLLLAAIGVAIYMFMGGTTGVPVLDDLPGAWPEPPPWSGPQTRYPAEQTVIIHVAGVDNDYIRDFVSDRLGRLVDPGRGSSGTSELKGTRLAMRLAPVDDPQAFADKIDCGVVRSVSGRTVTMVATKIEGPPADADPATKALFDLKSSSDRKRREALTRLKEMKPNPKSQELIQALMPLVDGPDIFLRNDAFEALAAVATQENVPFLLQALPQDKYPRRACMRALGRIKDGRAIEPLAGFLGNNFERANAIAALIAIGPVVEKAMIQRVRDTNAWTAAGACEVLKEVGTPACLPALEELAAKKDDALSVPKAIEAVKAIRARNKG